MTEHEAKILNVNPTEVKNKLEKLGAIKILDAVTYIEGYDFGNSLAVETVVVPKKFQQIVDSIEKLRIYKDMFSKGAYLRLRQEGEKFELIFKQKVQGNLGVKSEIELSAPIQQDEWDSVVTLLDRLGLARIVLQQKKRESYSYPPFRYDIDTWPGVPTYLEVEAPSPEEVLSAIALLGLSQSEALPISAADVFEMYGVKNPRHLIFSEEK